jgi:hypothetical protein
MREILFYSTYQLLYSHTTRQAMTVSLMGSQQIRLSPVDLKLTTSSSFHSNVLGKPKNL